MRELEKENKIVILKSINKIEIFKNILKNTWQSTRLVYNIYKGKDKTNKKKRRPTMKSQDKI